MLTEPVALGKRVEVMFNSPKLVIASTPPAGVIGRDAIKVEYHGKVFLVRKIGKRQAKSRPTFFD
jgi:hypothetical protein